MRKTPTSPVAVASVPLHPAVVAVNAAVVAFVDELLRLPSQAAAATVVKLLYGETGESLPPVLVHVNGGLHIPLPALLASPVPLATVIGPRLRIGSAWRGRDQALKGARASARARYRDLQAAFVMSAREAAPAAPVALIRYTYGIEGRQWLWEDAASRVLHRVVGLNRAVLGLLAAMARGEAQSELPLRGPAIAIADFDLPDSVLELLATALPPVAAPVWARFAEALAGSDAALKDEESVMRYRALLAEILGRSSALAETPA